MRVAWFAPVAHDVMQELARTETVDHYDRERAHEFVSEHFKWSYDLTVFELADTDAYAFVWGYLFHYPGILVLRATSLQHSRPRWLTAHRRHHHLRAERAFGGAHFLRAPLEASKLVVVHDDAIALELQDESPALRVHVIPSAAAVEALAPGTGGCHFHVAGGRHDVIGRAAARARDAGCPITLAAEGDPAREGDVMIALEWPPSGALPADAVRAMARGMPTVVLETAAAAAWPTLDPQTWQPRGYGDGEPIAVSIDPRDEEHSLMLTMRRLAGDERLRAGLADAARAWARNHADLRLAAAAWREVLQAAIHTSPTVARSNFPAHLVEDGTAAARAILDQFGATVDLFEREP